MTRQDYLLTVLMEECAEVTQVASKAIRFGLDSRNPKSGIENQEAIMREFYDIFATIEMLQDCGALPVWRDDEILLQMNCKKEKVNRLMKVKV